MTRSVAERRAWDQQYYREVLELFAGAGYRTATFSEYHAMDPAERSRILLLRQDIDERLDRARVLLEVHRELGFTSTWFVHVHASYNTFFYDGYAVVRDIVDSGAEIALHSNFLEFATYFDEDPLDVLRREKAMLEAVAGRPVRGHACHRDVNYVHNSLPYLEQVGHAAAGFAWQAYEPLFTAESEGILYVNEGLSPHLGWRRLTPEEAVDTGRNICLLVHPHWWHRRFHTGA